MTPDVIGRGGKGCHFSVETCMMLLSRCTRPSLLPCLSAPMPACGGRTLVPAQFSSLPCFHYIATPYPPPHGRETRERRAVCAQGPAAGIGCLFGECELNEPVVPLWHFLSLCCRADSPGKKPESSLGSVAQIPGMGSMGSGPGRGSRLLGLRGCLRGVLAPPSPGL